MILKNNFYNIVKTLLFSMFTFFVLMSIVFLMKWETGVIPYLIIILLILDFPAWYLFFTYFFKTKGTKIHIKDKQIVIISKYNKTEQYNLSEIEDIEYFKSKSEIALHPSMNYAYIKIKLTNEKHVYITCLMTSDLKFIIKSLKNEYKVKYGIPFMK